MLMLVIAPTTLAAFDKPQQQNRNENFCENTTDRSSQKYEPSPRCKSMNAVMVLQDCAKGPYGKGALLREQMEIVFGKYMCYSLFYGYLTADDLDEYNIIYIDGSGEDFSTVADWLSKGNLEQGASHLLEEFVNRGKTVFFNAAVSSEENWPLIYGAMLRNHQGKESYSVGRGGLLDSTYPTSTDSFGTLPGKDAFFAQGHIESTQGNYLPLLVAEASREPILVRGNGTAERDSMGKVLLGTMTPSDVHLPQPDSTNLRLNVLESLCQVPNCVSRPTMFSQGATALLFTHWLTNFSKAAGRLRVRNH